MKRYYKEENGTRTWLGNVLRVNGLQIINPSEEQILAAGYVMEDVHELTEEEIMENIRRGKLLQLHSYDESKEVNNCVIVYGGTEIDYWANKDERDFLKGAVRDCISLGRETYRLDLRDKGISISIPCESLLTMMAVLEVYAIDCYNRTTDHEFALKSFTTREEIEAYEFTGYPAQPRFEL